MILLTFLQIDGQTLSVVIRFLMAKTPQQRAAVDLDTHYSQVKKNSLPKITNWAQELNEYN